MRIRLWLALVGLGLTLTACSGSESKDTRSDTAARRSCPVTLSNRAVPGDAGFTAAGFNYGNRRLRAALRWPRGTLTAGILPNGGAMAIINEDGSIYAKLGWWRGVSGQLVVSGQRIDAPSAPLRADVGTPAEYGERGFVPSGLTFPTVGCWRVVGEVGAARLTFVVRVTKLATEG